MATLHSAQFNVAAHGLRGVASMMVLITHILGGTAIHIYARDTEFVSAVLPYRNIGVWGVCLFFMISGFVILESALRYSTVEFGWRRFMRIYPLFFAFTFLYVVLNAITNYDPAKQDWQSIIVSLLFLDLFFDEVHQLTPNAWSLTFEVMFYGLTAITVWAFRHRFSALRTGALALCAGFVIAFPIAIYFVIGLVVRWLMAGSRLERPRPALEVASLAACLLLASVVTHKYHWADFAKPEVMPLILMSGVYFALAVTPGSLTGKLLDNRVAGWLGAISYSLYLSHPYVYLPVRLMFDRLGWFTDNAPLSVLAAGAVIVPLSLLVATITFRWFEQWPYQKVFSAPVYRPGTAAMVPAPVAVPVVDPADPGR